MNELTTIDNCPISTSSWAGCVNAAINRTVGEALRGLAWRNLVVYHALNGLPLPENSESRLHETLAGRTLRVTFSADGFRIADVVEFDDSLIESADAV